VLAPAHGRNEHDVRKKEQECIPTLVAAFSRTATAARTTARPAIFVAASGVADISTSLTVLYTPSTATVRQLRAARPEHLLRRSFPFNITPASPSVVANSGSFPTPPYSPTPTTRPLRASGARPRPAPAGALLLNSSSSTHRRRGAARRYAAGTTVS